MSRIVHLACPTCRGTLGLNELDRIVECPYCESPCLVDGPEIVPKYSIAPQLDFEDARRELQKLLMDKEMPPGLVRNSRFHDATLYFVPYHELTGRRLGTRVLAGYTETRGAPGQSRDELPGGAFAPFGGTATQTLKHHPPDTKIIMGDVHRLEPGIVLPGWGLDATDIKSVMSDARGQRRPFEPGRLEKDGRVLLPTHKPEELHQRLLDAKPLTVTQDDTTLEDVRTKTVYYPLWRVHYQYLGRIYGATIDAVTGRIAAARAPQNDRSRVLWLIAIAAFVGFFAGKTLGGIISILTAPDGLREAALALVANLSLYLLPVLVLGVILMIAVVAIGWEQFRYPGEFVIEGDRKEVVKLGSPGNLTDRILTSPWVERLTELFDRSASSAADKRHR